MLAAGMTRTAGDAVAQSYPVKTVRVIIPNGPGGALDIVGRLVGQKLSEMWGRPVIIDNRPGAGGTIGTAMVAKSPADGYTLLAAASNHALNPALYTKLPYDSLRDFSEISPLAALYEVLATGPSVGFKSVSELV